MKWNTIERQCTCKSRFIERLSHSEIVIKVLGGKLNEE